MHRNWCENFSNIEQFSRVKRVPGMKKKKRKLEQRKHTR